MGLKGQHTLPRQKGVMKLKLWIAGDGDTLRKIADKANVRIEDLIALNPYISAPDLNISGRPVKLPSSTGSITKQISPFPHSCPPPTIPSDYLTQWIPLTSLEEMAETEYDVLIVGTGAGGGAVLWRLCEQWQNNGKRIGIIERGDLLLPTQARNLPTMDNERLNRLFESVSHPLPGSFPDYSGGRQLFALGGRTLFWNTISPRMSLSELASWPVSYDEMDAYYRIAEEIMNVSRNYTKGSSTTEILLERLQGIGYPESMPVPMAADLRSRLYAERDTDVFFSTMVFLAQALNRRPIDLAVRANAVRVLADKGTVTGLHVMSSDKKTYCLKAKNVVLSASTFETPRLLLHSGIQGNAIGHYLSNQSLIVTRGKMSIEEFPDVSGTIGILIPGTEKRPYQIQLRGPGNFDWYQTFQDKPYMQELEMTLFAFGKVEPRFANKVTLDPHKKDEYGVPEIRVQLSYSETDISIIRQTITALNHMVSALGITSISMNGQSDVCLMPRGILHHDSGTCRMGDDPLTSATNRYGQIHGVSGLYVADNSVLPSAGTANVTLTTVALAIRTADTIIRQE